MPEYALWTLIVSLIVLSIGLSCKIASLFHALKLMDKEFNSFVKEIDSLKKNNDKAISHLSQLNEASMEKIIKDHNKELHFLFNKISELQKPEGLLESISRITGNLT